MHRLSRAQAEAALAFQEGPSRGAEEGMMFGGGGGTSSKYSDDVLNWHEGSSSEEDDEEKKRREPKLFNVVTEVLEKVKVEPRGNGK